MTKKLMAKKRAHMSLLETDFLPSARDFAECQMSDTRQSLSLPSATLARQRKTLGKKVFANIFFAECN